MFDSRSEAEAACQRLTQSGLGAENARIVDKTTSGSSGDGASSSGGFWSSVKEAFMPPEDRHAYQEGVNRGGFLLCAQVDESRADEACRLIEESGSIDFDQRQDQWRSEGWSGYQAQASGGFQQQAQQGQQAQRQQAQQAQQQQAQQGQQQQAHGSTVEEERIPIVEEELRVGKREVERGGARVRSYVEERPVHEQVSLREERVSVERRPVDQPVSSGELDSDMLRERNLEMTERSEEAVVDKEARVREELVVRKTAQERTEQIDDTVRHTEVDVQQGGEDRSAFGFQGQQGGEESRSESEREREEFGRR
jgi:uncharacterized protein (TIGR02271 family)